MSLASERYSEHQAHRANLDLEALGLASWAAEDVKGLQRRVGARPDGWLGPKTIARYKAAVRKAATLPTKSSKLAGLVVLGVQAHRPPEGVRVVNHLQPSGIPAPIEDTGVRKRKVTQFVLHRGAEGVRKADEGNYARATERILDARGLSTTFSMDIDGTIYQHFDPTLRRGRHAKYHNVQSDSMDIGGPFSHRRRPVADQRLLKIPMAIGRRGDGKPPLKRKAWPVRCWSMTGAQIDALMLFVPWYCGIRGIPARACSDWRTFRLSGRLGIRDPATNVTGIVAHTQIGDPGRRVDGIVPLVHLLEYAGAEIEWRTGEAFWDN